MSVPVRLAVLASGGGSNLQALLDYLEVSTPRRAEVALVMSNRPDARALQRAHAASVDARVIDSHTDGDSLLQTLRDADIGLVVLAGYLKLVPAVVTKAFHGRVLNVHPALLPAFGGPGMYGRRVHQAVLDAGARVSGVTVHYVDDAYDRGPIVAQWPVPVLAGDSAESLAARVLAVEHALFPRAVEAAAEGRVALDESGRVRGSLLAPADVASFALSTDPTLSLGEVMDAALDR